MAELTRVTKTAASSALSPPCSYREGVAAGYAAELCSFCAFWAVRLLCREMASEERIKTHLPFPLLPSGGGPSNQTALLDTAGPILLPQFVLDYAGCVHSTTGVASRNRRLRWIFFFIIF